MHAAHRVIQFVEVLHVPTCPPGGDDNSGRTGEAEEEESLESATSDVHFCLLKASASQ